MANPTATNVTIKRDDERWELEVSGEIPADSLLKFRSEALKEITADAQLPGFRKGKAPESVVAKHYGEQVILEHAAEDAVKSELPELLAKEGANIVEAPRVSIATPEIGKSLKFVARAPLAPEVKLPDFKKIAEEVRKEKTAQTVSDEEHAEALTHLKRERARIEHVEQGKNPQEAAELAKTLDPKDLPALDDAFAQSVGYENAEKFSVAVKDNMKTEKEMRETEKIRAKLLDELVKASDIKYPVILKEYELDDMESRLAGDLERMGTTLEKYLSQSKKTKEDIRKDWLPSADQRAKVRLILSEIARKENIQPDPEAVDREIAHAKEHMKDADESALRAHITHAMRNQAVINFLEGAEPQTHEHHDHDGHTH
ncbi:MAG: hypothetical protein RIQ56_710 [Candidatus Parcubacteria bacterium]|jgi:trigger factor